jgi:hypothetical protein
MTKNSERKSILLFSALILVPCFIVGVSKLLSPHKFTPDEVNEMVKCGQQVFETNRINGLTFTHDELVDKIRTCNKLPPLDRSNQQSMPDISPERMAEEMARLDSLARDLISPEFTKKCIEHFKKKYPKIADSILSMHCKSQDEWKDDLK